MVLVQRKSASSVLRLVHSAPLAGGPVDRPDAIGPGAVDPATAAVDRHAVHLAALAEARRRRVADRSPEHWSIAAHSALAALRP